MLLTYLIPKLIWGIFKLGKISTHSTKHKSLAVEFSLTCFWKLRVFLKGLHCLYFKANQKRLFLQTQD